MTDPAKAHSHTSGDDQDATAFWEERYGRSGDIWSGNPNRVLVDEASELPVGRALDLGCGEGADSLWLARRGWAVTGLDISETALSRAKQHAGGEKVDITWLRADLATWQPDHDYEFVSACFLQSPVEFSREEVLRRASRAIVPGGSLLVVSHAAPPPWADPAQFETHHRGSASSIFLPAERVLTDLRLDGGWTVRVCEDRSRPAVGPDGEESELIDSVVRVQRHPR